MSDIITKAPKSGYTLVLVSCSWKGKRTLRHRGWAPTREGAERIIEEKRSKLFGEARELGWRIMGPRQLAKLIKEIAGERAVRRKKGATKAAATRKKRGAACFVLCPTCQAKSKKLFSEMGGLQTRKCKNGHVFEYDKWIADRAFWGPILGAGVPSAYVSNKK